MYLRSGTPGDLPLVFRLEKLYIEEMESDQITTWLNGVDRHLNQWKAALPRMTIAQEEGVGVGYLFWGQEGEKAVIASVNVDPPHRRKGIASALFKSFEEEALQAGCSVAELGFVDYNPAQHLYQKLGYQPAGVEGRYVLMVKHL